MPHRGMGGNQALQDTAEILPYILRLHKRAATNNLCEDDYTRSVRAFESAMIPRAFDWARKSGGTRNEVGNSSYPWHY
jgi:hypothetical protein